jgi:hypothetical protein
MLCRSARTLQQAGFNGPATTLLATALEEATKAGVLVLLAEDSIGGAGAHEDLVRKLFTDHHIKYRLAAWAGGTLEAPGVSADLPELDLSGNLVIGLGVLLIFFGLVGTLRSGKALPESPKLEMDAAELLAELAQSDPENRPDWIANAFDQRNAGLYVAFRDGRWCSPMDLTGQDVADARRVVVPLVRGAQAWARAGIANP